MAIFDSATTIRFEPAFYVAVDQIAAALNNLTHVVQTTGALIVTTLDEALDAIKQVGDDQAAARDVLLGEVAKVGAAVNALEDQIRTAMGGALSQAQQDRLDVALANFKANTQAITDAAATVKAGTDDAADGTAT